MGCCDSFTSDRKTSNMNIRHLKLVTFDVTNTLLTFRIAPGQYYANVGAQYGITCDGESISQNFKTHFKYMTKEHPNFGLKSGLGWENWWREVISKTFKDSNPLIKKEQLDALSYKLIDDFKTSSCWIHCRGALDLLSYLKHKGIVLGVVSNFDPRLDITLRSAKIRHYFKFILSSYEFGVEKPNPEIFHEAMKLCEIKQLKCEECLHVGDSVALDFVGAKNAGWNGVIVNSKKDEDLPSKDYTFSSLYQFHKYFLDGTGDKLLVQSST
ncbi:hypothetical protein FQR65_LT07357 [Abscondita terminalis]|nr:hypothetical protein FQR65_LT07357 [Abscondita terminalis]